MRRCHFERESFFYNWMIFFVMKHSAIFHTGLAEQASLGRFSQNLSSPRSGYTSCLKVREKIADHCLNGTSGINSNKRPMIQQSCTISMTLVQCTGKSQMRQKVAKKTPFIFISRKLRNIKVPAPPRCTISLQTKLHHLKILLFAF